MGYYFYYPPENKIVVERYTDFLEKDFILQKESGRIVELEDEYIYLPKTLANILLRKKFLPQLSFKKRMLFPFVDLLGDLNEYANYKAALSDPEFEKWLVAMNAKMHLCMIIKSGDL
uniref:Uncharacterized protein n=1 Tax=Tanacetum cinerariifolium TaxID=118510 RepID=A0A699SM89_TANCI|nr:hypothetical protein [Tanacetum cinerariifolium]